MLSRRAFLGRVVVGAGTFWGARRARAAEKPNILFILTDDQGWPTLGCLGGDKVPTPHLDRLAAQGTLFTNAYVQPQCTPTRASLLTGQHTARNGMWHVIGWYGYPYARLTETPMAEFLPPETFIIAKGLRAAGYATASIGKWHLSPNDLGGYPALKQEAGELFGFEYCAPPVPKEQFDIEGADRGVDYLTDETINFIRRTKDRPFFCYLAHHTIHGKVVAPKALVDKYLAKGHPETGLFNATYLAAIEHLDNGIGRLMAALDDIGVAENTLVVFLSDNGGIDERCSMEAFSKPTPPPWRLEVDAREYDNAPLREGKGSMYEGGIRVPCIVRWPGVARPGKVCDTPVHVVDWMPTLLSAAGTVAPPEHVADGVDLRPLFEGKSLDERALFWYLPFYELRWKQTPCAIVRRGDYKLIEFFGDRIAEDGSYQEGRVVELYDLGKDTGETENLAERMPELAQALAKELHDWMASVPVPVPGPNPHYDPERGLMETREKPDWLE